MNDTQVMNILSKIAETVEPFPRMRLAAALVYKNEIISIGTNKKKSHPFQKKFGTNEDAIFLHAETDSICNALRKYDTSILAKSRLYVCRVKWFDENKKRMILGMAKPCPGCQRAIATFNIKHVCYTTNEETYEYL